MNGLVMEFQSHVQRKIWLLVLFIAGSVVIIILRELIKHTKKRGGKLWKKKMAYKHNQSN